MRDKLQKAIDISRKTGDRIIVFDSVKNNDPYIIMGLDEYEKIVIRQSEVRNLTEDELLDKINRDIAVWKSDNEESDLEEKVISQSKKNNEKLDNFDCFEDDELESGEDENTYYYDESELSPLELTNEKEENIKDEEFQVDSEQEKPKNIWKIPGDIKKSAEEIM